MGSNGRVRVGVFDSGAGGLTVLDACRLHLPAAEFFYYGDNANAPYGSRPAEEIFRLVRGGVEALLCAGAEVVLLACNTATAVCAEKLRRTLSVPVVGMEPAVRPAAERGGHVLVLATPQTAASARLARLLGQFPQCGFTVFAPPKLAAAVEGMVTRGEPVRLEEHLPAGKFDGAVLGCTHYIYLKEEIAAFYGCPVYDGNEGTARHLKTLVEGLRVERGWSEITKTNKSLPPEWTETCVCGVKFIGPEGVLNAKIYERMFKKR